MSDFLQRTSNVVTLSSEEAECRKRIVINLKRIQGSVYPLVKTMWQVTSVEEAISPLPLVSHIAQFVMVVIQSKSGDFFVNFLVIKRCSVGRTLAYKWLTLKHASCIVLLQLRDRVG